jgi:hypothetical protein
MAQEPVAGISEAEVQHLHFLVSGISVTSSALSTLSNAQVAGNSVKGETVVRVAEALQSMVAKLRSVIAP